MMDQGVQGLLKRTDTVVYIDAGIAVNGTETQRATMGISRRIIGLFRYAEIGNVQYVATSADAH